MALRDTEREILERMRDGFELLTGRGLWGIHCILEKDGMRYQVHRSIFSKLRNDGLVRYSIDLPSKGLKATDRTKAILTEAGRRALLKA